MTADFRKLRLRQLDAALCCWREAALPVRPVTGWARAIRDALGMSSAVLARRLGITDSAVRKLENAESSDAITLGALRRVAAGLDCELQYALVPKQTLDAMRTQQALQVAREQVQAVSRTMALEDQALDPDSTQAQIDEVVQSLLSKPGKGLWR
jgi:predicted DNA-binding mobile mystery protein A